MKVKSYLKSRGIITVPLVFLFLLIIIPLTSAAPPVLSTVQSGSLEIVHPFYDTHQSNKPFNFYWHVLNTTTLLNNSMVNCAFHLYSKESKGEHIFILNNVTTFINGRDFEADVPASNFTNLGDYCYLLECNTANQTGAQEICFKVIPAETNNSSSFFWLIIVLGFGLVIFGLWKEDYALTTLGGFGLAFVGLYLLFYGIADVKNGMSNAIAIISLAFAGYVIVVTGLNFVRDNYE